MVVLDWQMRNVLPELRPEGRLNVLTSMMLHANLRLRCWPGTELLIAETGFEVGAVVAAKKWLRDRGAFVLVPYKHRVDEERALPPRQHIMQLTGIIRTGSGEIVRYLHMTPEAEAAIRAVVESLAKVSTVKVSVGETSLSEISIGETEDSSISKDGSTSKGGSKKDLSADADDTNRSTPKKPQPRKSNPMFDAVCRHLLEIDPSMVPKKGASNIAALSNWLDGKTEGTRAINVGQLTESAQPDDLPLFVAWYRMKNSGATLPQNITSLSNWWRKWLTAKKADQPNGAHGIDQSAYQTVPVSLTSFTTIVPKETNNGHGDE